MLPDFRIRQRDYLLEISRLLTQELNLDKLLVRIVTIAAEMLAGQAGLIALRKEGQPWEVAASVGVPNNLLRYLSSLLRRLPGRAEAAQAGVQELSEALQEVLNQTSVGLLTFVGLPLVAFDRLIGVIYIFRAYPGVFSRDDQVLLQAFADQAAIAVHNAQLYTQVRQEKRRIDALIDTVADGIIILDPGHIVERCNPAFARMWGKPNEAILGADHEALIRWHNRRQGITLEQAEAGGWPLTAEATLYVEGDVIRPDGSLLPVGITYAPLMSADGQLVNIIATVRDITHFRQAEELKSTFISVVSHELKTPVALIKGYVATLRRDDVRWERSVVADSLEVIEEEADRLSELIENLLDASRLQAGGIKLNTADVLLEKLAKRVVEKFSIQTSQHTFKLEFPDNFPSVLCDEDRMIQVFNNLVSNAIKYAPEGGEITVHGSLLPNEVIVCVSDQGPGIAASDAPFVFDRFYRSTDASRTTKGAGLGLYLTRAIIQAHNGRIWVDAQYRQGARICFALPRNP